MGRRKSGLDRDRQTMRNQPNTRQAHRAYQRVFRYDQITEFLDEFEASKSVLKKEQ